MSRIVRMHLEKRPNMRKLIVKSIRKSQLKMYINSRFSSFFFLLYCWKTVMYSVLLTYKTRAVKFQHYKKCLVKTKYDRKTVKYRNVENRAYFFEFLFAVLLKDLFFDTIRSKATKRVIKNENGVVKASPDACSSFQTTETTRLKYSI